MQRISAREVSIEEAVRANAKIAEFDEPYKKDYFENRYKNKKKLIIVAYVGKRPAGYMVSYDNSDGSLYCWMAGVDPKFRRKGILKAMMYYQDKWAKQNGYTKIKVKTRNYHRKMLSYFVKYGFFFTAVEVQPEIKDNRIFLEKAL